jgi:predicted transcriptional regulator
MSEDAALALLRLLAEHGDVSMPRAAKRLGLGASELHRLLVALGDDPRFGGLDLVERHVERDVDPHADGARTLLRLTARGRALCEGDLPDAAA